MVEEQGYLPTNEFENMARYPVLHAVTMLPNPLSLDEESLESQFANLTLDAAQTCRAKMLECLTGLTQDETAAKYLLLNLISRVNKRVDGIPLGIVNINLFSTEDASKLREELLKFYSIVLDRTMYFPLTLDSITKVPMVAVKNYETNRLERGAL